MSSELQLIIKSPVRREDFPLVFPLDQTVGQLKGRLAEEYPGRPGPASQKLIFAGRLLQDSATIQSVLESQKRAISGPHTFHLVVPPPEAPRPSSFVEEQGGYVPQPAAAPAAAAAPPPALPMMPAGGGGAGGMGAWRQQQLQQEEEQGFGFDAQQQAAGAYGLFRPNWALLIRLALAVYIFGQGGSWGRIVFLSVASVLYYAYQIGAFNSFQRVIVVRAEPARQAPPPQPQPREEQPQQHQEQPQQNESTPPTETTTRSPSSSLGLYRELENVVVPFFYSLLPSWQPGMGVHHVPAPPPAPAPVPAAAPAFHPHQD
ncbi:Homocysteine-responsive endoplasmic reticulum-resident ubiquitin-like domain member 1 protein [Balamuthia mandrillaris]